MIIKLRKLSLIFVFGIFAIITWQYFSDNRMTKRSPLVNFKSPRRILSASSPFSLSSIDLLFNGNNDKDQSIMAFTIAPNNKTAIMDPELILGLASNFQSRKLNNTIPFYVFLNDDSLSASSLNLFPSFNDKNNSNSSIYQQKKWKKLSALKNVQIANIKNILPGEKTFSIVRIMEIFLVQYDKVIFIDSNFVFNQPVEGIKTILKQLQRDEMIIVHPEGGKNLASAPFPPISSTNSTREGKGEKIKNEQIKSNFLEKLLINNEIFSPLIGFTKEGFLKIVKPILDCHRGLIFCDKGIDISKSSLTRRESIYLGRARNKKEFKLIWDAWEWIEMTLKPSSSISTSQEQKEKKTLMEGMEMHRNRKMKIAIGFLHISSQEDYKEQASLLKGSLEPQDLNENDFIIYIVNPEGKNLNYISFDLLEFPHKVFKSFHAMDYAMELLYSEAEIDNCDIVYANGIFRPGWIKRLTDRSIFNPSSHSKTGIMIMMKNNEEFWMIRELVGSLSIHSDRPIMEIIIIVDKPSEELKQVMQIWNFARVIEASQILYGIDKKIGLKSDITTRLVLMNSLYQSYENIVWIATGMAFREGSQQLLNIFQKKKMITIKSKVKNEKWNENDNNNNGKEPSDITDSIVLEGYWDQEFERTKKPLLDCLKSLTCDGKTRIKQEELTMMNESISLDSIGLYPLFIESTFPPISSNANGIEGGNITIIPPTPIQLKDRPQHYCNISMSYDTIFNAFLLPNGKKSFFATSKDEELFKKAALRMKLNGDEIEMKRETMETKEIKSENKGEKEERKREKIAIMVPTKNDGKTKAESSAIIRNFMRTFSKSLTKKDFENYIITIYIGFDQGDKLMDEQQELMTRLLREPFGSNPIIFKYYILPASKWLTFLWNALFLDALKDGNDYFYQVNDDLSFHSSGWLNWFIKELKSMNNVGVVGPNDIPMWRDCRLLTQSFVHKTHYTIHGTYFPMEIKDWYADNWIQDVYEKRARCKSKYQVSNGAVTTRYTVCDKPPWREAVLIGQEKIKKYLNDNNEINAKY